MPDDQDWVVCGLTITPFPFHHGQYFQPARPLICSAFLIDSSVLYVSDVRCVLALQARTVGFFALTLARL